MTQKQNTPPVAGCFVWRGLDAADLDGVGAFWALSDFKAYLVTFAKLIKAYADELVGVEEEILLLTLARDEPESLISETGDYSCLHVQWN